MKNKLKKLINLSAFVFLASLSGFVVKKANSSNKTIKVEAFEKQVSNTIDLISEGLIVTRNANQVNNKVCLNSSNDISFVASKIPLNDVKSITVKASFNYNDVTGWVIHTNFGTSKPLVPVWDATWKENNLGFNFEQYQNNVVKCSEGNFLELGNINDNNVHELKYEFNDITVTAFVDDNKIGESIIPSAIPNGYFNMYTQSKVNIEVYEITVETLQTERVSKLLSSGLYQVNDNVTITENKSKSLGGASSIGILSSSIPLKGIDSVSYKGKFINITSPADWAVRYSFGLTTPNLPVWEWNSLNPNGFEMIQFSNNVMNTNGYCFETKDLTDGEQHIVEFKFLNNEIQTYIDGLLMGSSTNNYATDGYLQVYTNAGFDFEVAEITVESDLESYVLNGNEDVNASCQFNKAKYSLISNGNDNFITKTSYKAVEAISFDMDLSYDASITDWRALITFEDNMPGRWFDGNEDFGYKLWFYPNNIALFKREINPENNGTFLKNSEYVYEGGAEAFFAKPHHYSIDFVSKDNSKFVLLYIDGKLVMNAEDYYGNSFANKDGTFGVIKKDSQDNKVIISNITFTRYLAPSTGSIKVADVYENTAINPIINNEEGLDYKILYKNVNADDTAYSENIPNKVGKYVAKIIFEGNRNYKGSTNTTTFEIKSNSSSITYEGKSLNNGMVNEKYEESAATATDSNEGNITYSLATYSTLPEGLTLSNDGKISGIPTKGGSFTFDVVASTNNSNKSATFTLIIDKALGTCSISQANLKYGEQVVPQVFSTTNEIVKEIVYKLKDAADSAYTSTLPRRVGTYMAKVTYLATDSYEECSNTVEFKIEKESVNVDDGYVSLFDKNLIGTNNVSYNDGIVELQSSLGVLASAISLEEVKSIKIVLSSTFASNIGWNTHIALGRSKPLIHLWEPNPDGIFFCIEENNAYIAEVGVQNLPSDYYNGKRHTWQFDAISNNGIRVLLDGELFFEGTLLNNTSLNGYLSIYAKDSTIAQTIVSDIQVKTDVVTNDLLTSDFVADNGGKINNDSIILEGDSLARTYSLNKHNNVRGFDFNANIECDGTPDWLIHVIVKDKAPGRPLWERKIEDEGYVLQFKTNQIFISRWFDGNLGNSTLDNCTYFLPEGFYSTAHNYSIRFDNSGDNVLITLLIDNVPVIFAKDIQTPLADENNTYFSIFKKDTAAVKVTINDMKVTTNSNYSIEKIEGDCDVSMGIVDLSSTISPTIESANYSSYLVEYKKQNADNSTYSTTVPTTVGDYVLRVTFMENRNYAKVVKYVEFKLLESTLTYESSSIINGKVDEMYVAAVNRAQDLLGGTITYELADNEKLPEGLSLDKNGAITGTPLHAGTYTFTIVAKANEKSASATFTLVIDKADGNGTIEIEDIKEGEELNLSINSTTNKDVVVEYKKQNADDSTYSTTIPTEAGEYVVRVTFKDSSDYNGFILTKTFTINENKQNKGCKGQAMPTILATLGLLGVFMKKRRE